MNQVKKSQTPVFRCEKCGELNWERKKKLFGALKCSVCRKSYEGQLDVVHFKSQSNSQGSSLAGLILDNSIRITDVSSGEDIELLVKSLGYIETPRTNEELWEVAHRSQQGKQKIVGKLRGKIRFAVPETGQVLTLGQESIRSITVMGYSFWEAFGGIASGAVGLVGELAKEVSKDIEKKPPKKLSKEDQQKRLEEGMETVRQTKEVLREIGLIPVSDSMVKQRQTELELEKSETKIRQQKLEQSKIDQDMKGHNKVETTPATEDKYAKAMAAEQQKLEHQLAVEAMQEMMTIQRLTERARFLAEWQKRMRKEYPDMAEDIFDLLDRLQTEEGKS